jgi:hypothetical protein
MFYLKKCAEKGCKRTGVVALDPSDTFCNLHSKIEVTRTVKFEPKDNENRDENGARVEDKDNKIEE